jgi:2'-5' RNA ligase
MDEDVREYGCLMAYIEPASANKVVELGKKIIPQSILYEVPGEEYGRETEPHVTIKYGFTRDLTDEEVKKIIGKTKSFSVVAEGLSTFDGKEFQVVKFDIRRDGVLLSMRKLCDAFPNKDSHPDFHPHMTLAYTKLKSFPHKKTGLSLSFRVNKFVYSPITGKKRDYNLS